MDINCSAKVQTQPENEGNDKTPAWKKICYFFEQHKHHLLAARNLTLLLLYLAYYGYAMYCNFGDEGSIQLTVFTGFGLAYLSWTKLQKWGGFKSSWKALRRHLHAMFSVGKRSTVIRWFLYLFWTLLFIVYIIINVALKDARKLRPLGGMAAFLLLQFVFSTNRRQINWNCVFYGTILQCLFGLFVIKTKAGTTVLIWFSDRLIDFIAYSDVGSEFVFGEKYVDHPFAMKVMPSIIMFVAFITVLIYLRVIHFIVRLIGIPLAFILDVSSPEATVAVTNIFIGAVPPKYLLAASVMSAPASLVCSKLIYPEEEGEGEVKTNELEVISEARSKHIEPLASTDVLKQHTSEAIEQSQDNEAVETGREESGAKDENDRIFTEPKNIGEALVLGTKSGIKLVASIVGLVIVAFAVLELLNGILKWFGDRVNIDISLNEILSYLFYPFAYMMGVDTDDCLRAGEMLGIRTMSAAIISYGSLGKLIRNRELLTSYTTFVRTLNETFTYDRTSDIYLPHWNVTLPGGVISERSEVIVAYALCGLSSIVTLGILFGFVTTFAPQRLREITTTRIVVRLLVAGTVASYLTACIAGLLL